MEGDSLEGVLTTREPTHHSATKAFLSGLLILGFALVLLYLVGLLRYSTFGMEQST
jgi:hypothetical protein